MLVLVLYISLFGAPVRVRILMCVTLDPILKELDCLWILPLLMQLSML